MTSTSSPPTDTALHVVDSRLHGLSLPATTDPPGANNPPKQAVWLVFGATGHFGRFIVKAALEHGDKVCAVGRTLQDDVAQIEQWNDDKEVFVADVCDVRIRESVEAVIVNTIDAFGAIDVIANCAGYGVVGSCEDQDEYEIRNQFETNFMGTLNIIQLSLPHFRERMNGRYLIFSSISGALGVPGIGPFCATKYAVEGLVESMLYEVDGFNIKVTLVEPGHLKRDTINEWSKTPLFGHFKVAKPSEPYDSKESPAEHWKRTLQWIGDNAPSSAIRSAELIWQLGHCSYPPLRLLLGSYAVESIRDRLKGIIEEIEDWKHLHFPPHEGQEQQPDADDAHERLEQDHGSNHDHDEHYEHLHDDDDDDAAILAPTLNK